MMTTLARYHGGASGACGESISSQKSWSDLRVDPSPPQLPVDDISFLLENRYIRTGYQ